MSDTLTDYTELYLANAYTDGDLTLDAYAKNASYKLTDQKTSSLITELYLAAIDRDDDTKFMGFKISNVVENGLWQTKTRYTLTIATSDGSNPMAGLANTYDGTTADANIIAANQLDSLPADSLILCSIGSGVLRKLSTEFASGTTSETISLGSGELFAIRSQLALHTDGKYYKYHKTNYPNWKGTAGSAATASGESFTLRRPGYRVPGYAGLTIGVRQYAENTGATTETASATTQYIGKAFSATQIDLEASAPGASEATQVQAEAGTAEGVYMDPLRTKDAIDFHAQVRSKLEFGEGLTAGDIFRLLDDSGTPKAKAPVFDDDGNLFEWDSGSVLFTAVVEISEGKYAVAYRDYGDGTKGKVKILTWNGTTFAAGLAVTFLATATTHISIAKLDTDKFVVVYRDTANTDVSARAATVVGTVPTFGTEKDIDTSDTDIETKAIQISTDKFAMVYAKTSNGKCAICTVSGTTITAGSPVNFDSGGGNIKTPSIDRLTDSSIIIGYVEDGTDEAKAVAGTISGTVPTFGTAVTLATVATLRTGAGTATIAMSSKEAIIFWSDTTNSKGTCIPVGINGTVVTAGTAVDFATAGQTPYLSGARLNNGKFVIAFKDTEVTDHGTYRIGQYRDGAVSFSNVKVVFSAINTTNYISLTKIAGDSFVIAYQEGVGSDGQIQIFLDERPLAVGIAEETGAAATTKFVAYLGEKTTVLSSLPISKKLFIQEDMSLGVDENEFPFGRAFDDDSLIITKNP